MKCLTGQWNHSPGTSLINRNTSVHDSVLLLTAMTLVEIKNGKHTLQSAEVHNEPPCREHGASSLEY